MAYDKFDSINGVLCGIYRVAKEPVDKRNDSDGAERFLTSTDMEIVLDLVHHKIRGINCDYVLHLLLWTLKDENFSEILRKMSLENVGCLKDAILVAKDYKYPQKFTDEEMDNIKKAEYPERELGRRTVRPENRKDTTAKRYAALVTNQVVECWAEAVLQMDKWLGAIEEYEKNPSVVSVSQTGNQPIVDEVTSAITNVPQEKTQQVNKERYSLEELAEMFGYTLDYMRMKKYRLDHNYPEFAELWFTKENGKVYLIGKYLPDLKDFWGSKKSRKKKNGGADLNPANFGGVEGLTEILDNLEAMLARLEQTLSGDQENYQNLDRQAKEASLRAQEAKEKMYNTQKQMMDSFVNLETGMRLLQTYKAAKNDLQDAQQMCDFRKAMVLKWLFDQNKAKS